MNREGYQDPTAEVAVKNAQTVPDDVRKLVYQIKAIASIAGYEVAERIILRDKETGVEWK